MGFAERSKKCIYYGSQATCPPCIPFREGLVRLVAIRLRSNAAWHHICTPTVAMPEQGRRESEDTTPCTVTPVILHGVVSPERAAVRTRHEERQRPQTRGVAGPRVSPCRLRTKREHLKTFDGVLPESRGHNLALAVEYVPLTVIYVP